MHVKGLIEAVGRYLDGVCLNNFIYADDMVLLFVLIYGMRKLLEICEIYTTFLNITQRNGNI